MSRQLLTSLFSFLLGASLVLLVSYSGVTFSLDGWTSGLYSGQEQRQITKTYRAFPKLFCMIFTTPSTWDTKANAINLTWAQRCSGYAFFYSKPPVSDDGKEAPPLAGAFPLTVPEGREHLTAKVLEAIRISHRVSCQQKQPFDWFLKADDDVYVIMENLRQLLSEYDPERGLYFGHASGEFLPHGYNSGGAGYVLSREAVKLLAERSDQMECTLDGGFEDVEIGKCLSMFHIYPINTRDDAKRIKFHPDHPVKLLMGQAEYLAVYMYSKGNQTFGNPAGTKVMSPDTISFHYVDPAHILMYDFLLYDLHRPEQFMLTELKNPR